ncbi:MAG TPA: hypothetical protein VL200_10210 [Lacunisphaera sp.]|jgi:tetratricopeptide (TPR) repeat protein|nr:hypothetical protein [Lacunisphaera sp.]
MNANRRGPADDASAAPYATKPRRPRWRGSRLRDWWWWLLDLFEAHRWARVTLYAAGAAVIAGFAAWFWLYPEWNRRNSIRLAQQWLAAGRLRYAAEAAQRAAELSPQSPEPWRIAAELARRGFQFDQALTYSRRAAELAPGDQALALAWAADALRAGADREAATALERLPVEFAHQSPDALRLRGELARRELRLTAARGYFEAALKIDGAVAVDEVPLGLVLSSSTNPAERRHGLDLLAKWTGNRDWGATAARMLLEDALTRKDHSAMLRWAETLRQHPGCTLADMPRCLVALSLADPARFAEVLAKLEQDHAGTPQAAAQLLGWLTEIGQGAEAARWIQTLPSKGMRQPPLAVAAAEALRQTGDWPALAKWTDQGNWGGEAEFLRWAYRMLAARKLGEAGRAGELWRTLYDHAQLNDAHGYFAGSLLYSWGLAGEAVDLWWRASAHDDPVAIDALGSLARYYQLQRDADGQYRAFRRLHTLKPNDPGIANNFAFFALVTSREERVARDIAQANLDRDPGNVVYVATAAFARWQRNEAAAAAAMLRPLASQAAHSPALAFAYGLALAGTGHKPEAHQLLDNLPADSLTIRETELIRSALAD